jgi:hypothetical protein
MKKSKTTEAENLMTQIAALAKCSYDSGKIGHFQAIGAIESAKFLFIHLNELTSENKNDC